jgi:hypothetical protein
MMWMVRCRVAYKRCDVIEDEVVLCVQIEVPALLAYVKVKKIQNNI